MPRVRAHGISVSLDGFMAGPGQGPQTPLGVGGEPLHRWVFDGRDPVDRRFLDAADAGIGATVIGRNMFGPVRGPWGEPAWTGWWGDEPPYHHDVFVLTHHPREPLVMAGGTTFHFVTDGAGPALDRALEAAGGADVRVGGGAATLREYLRAGVLDELHVVVVPVLLGRGERLFGDLDDGPAAAPGGYACAEIVSSTTVSHVRMVREG